MLSFVLSGDNLIEGVKLIPVMKQSVEKAKQQPNQVAMVMEGFSAACCLAQIALADVGAGMYKTKQI